MIFTKQKSKVTAKWFVEVEYHSKLYSP